MSQFTFRFGEFRGDQSLPPLSHFQEIAEKNGIYGPSGEERGAYNHQLGRDYFYMEFAKEVPEEILTLEEGSFEQEEISRARMMKFIIFEDGTYGYESRRGVYDSDAFEYLLEDHDFEYELSRLESLSLDTMRSFYKNSSRVKKIKAEDLGEYEPNPHVTDEEIRDLTEDFGRHSKSVVASVGRKKEDLADAKMIKDGIAKYSGLSMIRSVTSEGALRRLRDSARFDFGVSEERDEEEQAEEVRDVVSNFIRTTISNETVDSDDDD